MQARIRSLLIFTFSAGLLLVALAFFTAGAVQAAPAALEVGGTLPDDTTWTLAGSPYTMTSSVIVPTGITLTIEPGVIVRGYGDTELTIRGHLEAVGTSLSPIILTSNTNSGPGQWNGLVFDGGTGNLEHVIVRYGASGNNSLNIKSNVTTLNSTVRIASSTVMSASCGGSMGDYGIYIQDSQVIVTDTLIAGNGSDDNVDYALYATGNCTLTITGNTFSNNGGWAARVEADDVQDIHANTFAGNGYDRVRIASGVVAEESRMAAQSGLEAYYMDGGLAVPTGATLTVESGVKTMFPYGSELTVWGHLEAVGTATQPITFTSTNDNGPGQWNGLVFDGGTGNLEHVIVRYGASDRNSIYTRSNLAIRNGRIRIASSTITRGSYGGSVSDYGLYIQESQAVITDSLITANGADLNADYGLYATGNCTLTITGNTFSGNAGWAARIEADDVQDIHGNTFSGNGYDRVRVAGGEVSEGAVMAFQEGLEGYEPHGTALIVPAEITLTVEPGVQVMAKDIEVRVQGQLEAVGTATQPITFTSISQSSGGWRGLLFYGGYGHLEHATVRYAGQTDSAGMSANVALKGGALYGSGLRLVSSRVLSSTAAGVQSTGGILVISETLISGNDGDGLAFNGLALTLQHTTLRQNGGHGLNVSSGIAALQCSTFAANTGDGIYVSGTPMLIPQSSAIYDNGGMGMNNTTGNIITATHNYWGAVDGPSGEGPGSGDEVSTDIVYDPWLPYATCYADLDLQVTASPTATEVGEPLTFTHVITNHGPNLASNVAFTATLPVSATFVTATTTAGTCQVQPLTLTCGLGTAASGKQITITAIVTTTAEGNISELAEVDGIDDPIRPNNVQTTTVTITPQRYIIYLPLVLRNR